MLTTTEWRRLRLERRKGKRFTKNPNRDDYTRIKTDIATGVAKANRTGMTLRGNRELRIRYKIRRNTLIDVLKRLAEEGWLAKTGAKKPYRIVVLVEEAREFLGAKTGRPLSPPSPSAAAAGRGKPGPGGR